MCIWSCCYKLRRPSRVGPFLFLLYKNDLNQAIKLCKIHQMHHFAYDTDFLCLSNSTKKLNKLAIADLKDLVNCLNATKISLNLKN